MKRRTMPDNKPVSPLAASAKINLTLSVTGRNEAGYHQLVSAVGFTRFADRLHLTKAPKMSLEIAGPFAANLPGNEADNLILSAHRLAHDFAKKSGLMLPACHHILLEKHIPIGGGLGGGSADAAAYLRYLSAGWDEAHIRALRALSVKLGADVPACFDNQCHVMAGIGDAATPIKSPYLVAQPPKNWPFMVITNPHCHADTASVFKAYAKAQTAFSQHNADDVAQILATEDWDRLFEIGNDLTNAACHIYPEIGILLAEMAKTGHDIGSSYMGHAMSGSGASCFALFQSEDGARAFHAACQEKGFWSVETRFF